MIISMYIFRTVGDVNEIFAVIHQADHRKEGADAIDEVNIKETLRYDREKYLHGFGIPDENPSQDSSVVQFYYTPSMARQKLYASGFPVNMGTYEIIDAFVCLGSRFGLHSSQVYVELCRSDMGGRRYWANIYYIADSEMPACIIKIVPYFLQVNTDEMLQSIERDRESEKVLKKSLRQLKS